LRQHGLSDGEDAEALYFDPSNRELVHIRSIADMTVAASRSPSRERSEALEGMLTTEKLEKNPLYIKGPGEAVFTRPISPPPYKDGRSPSPGDEAASPSRAGQGSTGQRRTKEGEEVEAKMKKGAGPRRATLSADTDDVYTGPAFRVPQEGEAGRGGAAYRGQGCHGTACGVQVRQMSPEGRQESVPMDLGTEAIYFDPHRHELVHIRSPSATNQPQQDRHRRQSSPDRSERRARREDRNERGGGGKGKGKCSSRTCDNSPASRNRRGPSSLQDDPEAPLVYQYMRELVFTICLLTFLALLFRVRPLHFVGGILLAHVALFFSWKFILLKK
jgi:hypothetical protein